MGKSVGWISKLLRLTNDVAYTIADGPCWSPCQSNPTVIFRQFIPRSNASISSKRWKCVAWKLTYTHIVIALRTPTTGVALVGYPLERRTLHCTACNNSRYTTVTNHNPIPNPKLTTPNRSTLYKPGPSLLSISLLTKLTVNVYQWCCPWPWSLAVLKDQISVLGPVLALEGQVLGPGLGLEGAVLAKDYIKDQGQRQHHWNNYLLNIIGF